jgi:membrane protease YdiL (CAAX protease family)
MRWTRWLRLPGAVLLAALVFIPSGQISMVIGQRLPPALSQEWLSTSIFQLLMAAMAILFMLILGKGRLGGFGFTRGSSFPALRVARAVFLAEAAVTVAFLPFSQDGPGHFAEGFSFFQIVVGVWIIASTCEEVVTRGLVQTFLDPLRNVGLNLGRARISLPILMGALLFSAMHVPLLIMGIDTVLGVQILISTFLLGLIAGFYREVTGSLLPAILAHILANVFGMGLSWIVEKLAGG